MIKQLIDTLSIDPTRPTVNADDEKVTLRSHKDGLIQIMHLYSKQLRESVTKFVNTAKEKDSNEELERFSELLSDLLAQGGHRLESTLFLAFLYATLNNWHKVKRTLEFCERINQESDENHFLYDIEIQYFLATALKKIGKGKWNENALEEKKIKGALENYCEAYKRIIKAFSSSEKKLENALPEYKKRYEHECTPRLLKERASIIYMYHHALSKGIEKYGDSFAKQHSTDAIPTIDYGIELLEQAHKLCGGSEVYDCQTVCRLKLAILGNIAYYCVMNTSNPDYKKAIKAVDELTADFKDTICSARDKPREPWPYLEDTILYVTAKCAYHRKDRGKLTEQLTKYEDLIIKISRDTGNIPRYISNHKEEIGKWISEG